MIEDISGNRFLVDSRWSSRQATRAMAGGSVKHYLLKLGPEEFEGQRQ
jgi:hypothetical protein